MRIRARQKNKIIINQMQRLIFFYNIFLDTNSSKGPNFNTFRDE